MRRFEAYRPSHFGNTVPQRRTPLSDYIPQPADPTLPQSQPALGPLGYAENVSAGIGKGVRNQLAGLLRMAQNPKETLGAIYGMATTPSQWPAMAKDAAVGMYQGATSGPLGFGEFVGNNISPRSLLPGVKTTREMTAYHGTPHDFDKFDSSKIGTGEGAQAYGHGLYFAESPDVARGYQTRIAGGSWVDKRGIKKQTNQIAQDVIDQARRDGLGVLEADEAAGFWSIVARDGDKASGTPGYASIKKVLDDQGIKFQQEGKLYHVDIPDEAIDKMLDWDKPLSQQPEAVRAAFANAADDLRYGPLKKNAPILDPNDKYTTAGDAYKALALHLNGGSRVSRMGGSVDGADKMASEYLKSIGIPGIRYLDGGSRAQGAGTRNFVVFDDKLVKMLKKE